MCASRVGEVDAEEAFELGIQFRVARTKLAFSSNRNAAHTPTRDTNVFVAEWVDAGQSICKACAHDEDILTRHPEIDHLVGHFEYNEPTIFDNVDHVTSNIMLPVGGLLIVVFAGWGAWLAWRRKLAASRWFLAVAVWAVVTPFLMNTAGWLLTESGRQPWLVFGLQRTADGVSLASVAIRKRSGRTLVAIS